MPNLSRTRYSVSTLQSHARDTWRSCIRRPVLSVASQSQPCAWLQQVCGAFVQQCVIFHAPPQGRTDPHTITSLFDLIEGATLRPFVRPVAAGNRTGFCTAFSKCSSVTCKELCRATFSSWPIQASTTCLGNLRSNETACSNIQRRVAGGLSRSRF